MKREFQRIPDSFGYLQWDEGLYHRDGQRFSSQKHSFNHVFSLSEALVRPIAFTLQGSH